VPALWLALALDVLAAAVAVAEPRALPAGVAVAVPLAAALATLWALLDGHRCLQAAAARIDGAEAALHHLREALNELPTGLEIYDSDDRLIFFNRRMDDFYPWIHYGQYLGKTFESILRDSVYQGRIPKAIGREQQWLQERLAIRGTRDEPMLQSLKGGRWMSTYEWRTPSNYVVGVRLDVTDLVEKTHALQASGERLQAIIQSATVGIVLADAAGRVVEANPAALAIFAPVDGLQGRPLADFVPQLELEPAPAGAPSPPIRQPQEQPGRTGEGRPLQLP
jgi:PAS domain-containing protein